MGIITRLLDRVADLGLTIRRLYLYRSFFCVPVIRWLITCVLPFVLPVIVRGKEDGTRALIKAKRTYKTYHTLHSPQYGSVIFEAWVIGTYTMGKYGRHGVEYQAFAVYKCPSDCEDYPTTTEIASVSKPAIT